MGSSVGTGSAGFLGEELIAGAAEELNRGCSNHPDEAGDSRPAVTDRPGYSEALEPAGAGAHPVPVRLV